MTQSKDSQTDPAPIDFDQEFTTGFTARYVRHKSRQLVGHVGLKPDDQPDLEQQLLMEVWRAVPQFDPAAGDWRAFAATVVERKATRLLSRRRAEKRKQESKIESLDVRVADADGVNVSRASQIGSEHRSALTGVHPLDELELTELRIDLETLLGSLTDEERELLDELLDLSQTEVATLHGVSRRTIRGVLERARSRFGQIDGKFSTGLLF